jgi:hypothetical protein
MLWFLIHQSAFSQEKWPLYKISPGLLKKINSGVFTGKSTFIITISGKVLPGEIKALNAGEKKINDYASFSFFEIRVTVEELLSKVLPAPGVIFAEDASLKKGLNICRIKLELTGGGVIYSQQETVYYLRGNDFIVFPNPVQQNQPINILASDSQEETRLLIYNSQGNKLAEYVIENTVTSIPSGRLSKGLYIFRFTRKGQPGNSIKVFVY